ncbi:MAG: S1 family peptidase [Atribacterota bacterium]
MSKEKKYNINKYMKSVVHVKTRFMFYMPVLGGEIVEKYFLKLGTGFIIDKKNNTYYILTASHVVTHNNILIMAHLKDIKVNGDRATIVSNYIAEDFAVLKIKTNKKYPIMNLCSQCVEGQPAWLIGHPGGKREDKFVVTGHVAYRSEKKLYFDGNGLKGMSGAPMINKNGDAIGVIIDFFSEKEKFIGCIPIKMIEYYIRRDILMDQWIVKLAKFLKWKTVNVEKLFQKK